MPEWVEPMLYFFLLASASLALTGLITYWMLVWWFE